MYIMATFINVMGFGKTWIVHTCDFANSKIHKIWQEQYTDLKFLWMMEEW